MFKQIRGIAFWPAFVLLAGALIYNFINPDSFMSVVTSASNWMIGQFGWAFSMIGMVALLAVIVAYLSPLGKIKIGGEKAEPLMSKANWFAITLCTTLAAGIVFWGTAEPMYHLAYPPSSLGMDPFSPEAAKYAMETMYLHWTFTPYAFYALPTMLFAIAFYNMKKPFSIGSQLAPISGKVEGDKFYQIVDAICMFCLGAGAAAAFGTAVLNMAGALNSIVGIESNPATWFILSVVVVVTFVISSSTGLMKGIRILSSINMQIYYVIVGFVFLAGPTAYFLNLGTEAFGGYLTGFFEKNLFTGASSGDMWPQWWTTFYWAVWMAWAPVTACFLGRIAYGRTVRELLNINFIMPSLFSGLWMTIFSGTAVNFQMTGRVDLVNVLETVGPEGVGYALLRELPLSGLIIPFFLVIVFITAITAFDSTTNSMSGLSVKNISVENQEAPTFAKVLWGVLIGGIAYIMISATGGVAGIKTLSNLGGFPAILLELGAAISVFVMVKDVKKYEYQEDESEELEEAK